MRLQVQRLRRMFLDRGFAFRGYIVLAAYPNRANAKVVLSSLRNEPASNGVSYILSVFRILTIMKLSHTVYIVVGSPSMECGSLPSRL